MVLCLLRKGNFAIVDRTLLLMTSFVEIGVRLYLAAFAPLLKDALALCVRLGEGLLGRQLARGGLAHHLPEKPAVVDLRDRRIGIAWITDIGGPVPGVREHLVLVGWGRLGVMREEGLQIWHCLREARHIVKLTGQEAVPELPYIVHQKL